MSLDKTILGDEFNGFLAWERWKKNERVLGYALFSSLIISLALILVLPLSLNRVSVPVFFLIFAPAFFRLFPWRRSQSMRAIFRLDRRLGMKATGLTAWEILERGEKDVGELLVLEQAMEKLSELEPRRVFRRELWWHFFFLPLLFAVWVFLAWFPAKVGSGKVREDVSMAQRLKEFSRELHGREEFSELKESSILVRRLEIAADQSLKAEIGEDALKKRIAEALRAIESLIGARARGVSALTRSGSTTEDRELSGMLREIEELKEAWSRPGMTGRETPWLKEQLNRLGSIPKWKEEMEETGTSFENLKEDEMQRVVDQVEKSVLSELDHRALSEIQAFLGSLLDGTAGVDMVKGTERAGRPKFSSLPSDDVTRGGSEPGDAQGAKQGTPAPSARLEAQLPSHLRGLLGEGMSVGLRSQGGGQRSESGIPEEEVIASYRRQAEKELGSEMIPEGFRDAIRRYFLFLGSGGGRGNP